MNYVKANSQPNSELALERMIEPLASYICATEQPRAALSNAFAALFREVQQINGSATAHLDGSRKGSR